jgi:hypothetical protein
VHTRVHMNVVHTYYIYILDIHIICMYVCMYVCMYNNTDFVLGIQYTVSL